MVAKIKLDFEKLGGLIPAVAQDSKTGEILLLAFQNREAFDKTVATGEAHFWSRSRKKLWKKGETSGNVLRVEKILVDCDADSIILKIATDPNLRACHTGARSCFFREIEK